MKMTKLCKSCGKANCTRSLLHCSKRCGFYYHYYCMGISKENFKKMSRRALLIWKCEFCKTRKHKASSKAVITQDENRQDNAMQLKCILCNVETEDELNLGKLFCMGNIKVHYFCVLLASLIAQNGKDNEGIFGFLISDILQEAVCSKKRKCSYCGKQGAAIFCSVRKCRRIFHLPCGLQKGSLHRYFGHFRSFCHLHCSEQKVPDIYKKDKTQCLICLCDVSGKPGNDTLWPPCCKNAWFHKVCVQRLALSTGYFFKCPLCNDNRKFMKEMQRLGVYVPFSWPCSNRDASWELEGNQYEGLMFRHSNCDADICICPKGRSFSGVRKRSRKWSIELCQTCGSQGCHKGCLKNYSGSKWECSDCVEISERAKTSTEPNRKSKFGSKGSATITKPNVFEPTCSSSVASLRSSTSNNVVFSDEYIGLEKTSVDNRMLSYMTQEEFSNIMHRPVEDSMKSLSPLTFVNKFSSEIISQEHCNHTSESSNSNTDNASVLSFSNEFSSNGSSQKENFQANESNKFEIVNFFNKGTVENFQEKSSPNPTFSNVKGSQSLSLLTMSVNEILEQRNLAQKNIEDSTNENVVETFSDQSHKCEGLFSYTHNQQTSDMDFSNGENDVSNTIDVEDCNKQMTVADQEIYNSNFHKDFSVYSITDKTNQETDIENAFSFQQTEQVLRQMGNSCSSSANNQETLSTSSLNKFSVNKKISAENCKFIVNLFSKFMQNPILQFPLLNVREKNVIQATSTTVFSQLPVSTNENFIADSFDDSLGQTVFKCLNKQKPTEILLKEVPDSKLNSHSVSVNHSSKVASDTLSKEIVNENNREESRSNCIDNMETTQGNADIIEVSNYVEVIDAGSDIEIVELEDTEEPRVVYNIDEDVIELID